MTEYLTYLSLGTNVALLAGLIAVNKQLKDLQISLDLALEVVEFYENENKRSS